MDNPTGASPAASPTAPTPDSSSILASLSPEDYSRWSKDGSLPDGTADSSSAPSGEQSASNPDAKEPVAASEPAKPAESSRKNAETRIPELLADRAAERTAREAAERRATELEARLNALEGRTAKPDSAPAATKAERKRYLDHPDAPKQDDFATYEEWVEEVGIFVADKRIQEREQASQQRQQREQHIQMFERIANSAAERVKTYEAANPGFREKVSPDLLQIKTVMQLRPEEKVGPQHVVMEEIVKSEHTAELLLHFSTPEGQAAFRKLMTLPPAELLKGFGRIEAQYEKRAEVDADKPAPKTVTSAPEPPTTLGKKPAQAADDLEGALKAGDVARYNKLADARDVAARR